MKTNILFSFIFCFFIISTKAQTNSISSLKEEPKKGLFESDQILDITLKGSFHQIVNDRVGEAKYYPVELTYKGTDSSETSIPIEVKTRGHFRREKGNCTFPPLLLKFSESKLNSSSFFPAKSSLKLVMPCQGEEYIIHEWLVYKLYNLITPESFRARLVRVTLLDPKRKKMPSPFYGIILEDEKAMAKRNNMVVVKRKMRPQQVMQQPFIKMAVFEYLIGNTDWSVDYQQNIKLIAADSTSQPIAVPYDFDLSGIVNSPYAKPAPELEMSSVRQRRYRGYCIKDITLFYTTIAFYNRMKNKIYSNYIDCPLIDEKYKKKTKEYLDEFYQVINNPKMLEKEFEYPCNPNGTGNVIIKGLRED
ncbi:MAG TPA: hypothetical protein VLS85_09170 [Hanamia sp.]|nr:hypothetical protein [Hanamia sp.]